MTGRHFANVAKQICCCAIGSCVFLAAVNTRATTVVYTLDNIILGASSPMTGTFSWTFTSEFENGVGEWISLDIPWTLHDQNDLITTFEVDSAIEITLETSVQDDGIDIFLVLAQPLTPTTSSLLDLVESKYNIGGNGSHVGLIRSGSIVPSTALAGDFDTDGDVDGSDFLKWQRGEVSSPPSAADLTAWEASGSETLLSANVAAVPEPNAVLLCVTASLVGLAFRRCA